MYDYVSGQLVENQPGFAVVDCHGVGFLCKISFNTAKQLPPIGQQVKLFTYFAVKEDAQDLYGFCQRQEEALFKLLITVSGVGPKAAMALLSDLTPESLTLAILSGDAKALTRAAGIGKKMSERLVLELKDTLAKGNHPFAEAGSIAPEAGNDSTREAINALMVLGYSKNDAAAALAAFDGAGMGLEDMIRRALKQLM